MGTQIEYEPKEHKPRKYKIKFIFKWEEHELSTYRFDQKFLYRFNPKFLFITKVTKQIRSNSVHSQNKITIKLIGYIQPLKLQYHKH